MQAPPPEALARDRSELAQIATAPAVDSRLRVLVAELLADAGQPPDPSLADVYAKTLPDGFAHNLWGMPGQYVERLGRTLLGFGDAAIPSLEPLLDNRSPLGYFGSEEPTLSKKMHFRVADLAAYFLSQLLGTQYRADADPRVRDAAIRSLKASLVSGGH